MIGFLVTFGIGYSVSLLIRAVAGRTESEPDLSDLVYRRDARRQFGYTRNWYAYYLILAGYFCLMVLILVLMNR